MTANQRKEYEAVLKKHLSKQRFHHSQCVAEEAVRLAKKYGADVEKAELAGLLHDVMKEESTKDQLECIKKDDAPADSIMLASPKLWHAAAGASYIRRKLGVTDTDVLNAVRYHTTARVGMSLLEQVIYLADYTSADRDYNEVDVMRKLVNKGIPAAMKFALSYTISDLVSRSILLAPDTTDAYNEIILAENKR